MESLLSCLLALCSISLTLQQEMTPGSCKERIGNTAKGFDCVFTIDGLDSDLRCVSLSSSSKMTYQAYVYFLQMHHRNLEGACNSTMCYFRSILTGNNGSLYSCSQEYQDFYKSQPVLMSQNCDGLEECVQEASEFILEKHIRKLEVTNIKDKDSGVLQFVPFPSVSEVSFYNNVYVDMKQFRFKDPEVVSDLSLQANNIVEIHGSVFDGFTQLNSLDLSANRISLISQLPLDQLLKLNLSYNSLKKLQSGVFDQLTALEALQLSHNKLQNLRDDLLQFNSMLKDVSLDGNNVKQIPEALFRNSANLEILSCSECKLRELKINTFANATKLLHVDFSGNELTSVPEELFNGLDSLQFANFSRNRIHEFPSFRGKKYLKYLDISCNELAGINKNLSEEAPNLSLLDVSENRLSNLTDNDIKNFFDLELFDLSKNNITFVQLGISTDYVLIRKLYLADNAISTFEVNWKRFMTLEIIDLNHNELTYLNLPPCIPSVKQTITFSFQFNNISRLNLDELLFDQGRYELRDRTMAGCLFNGMSKNFVDISHNPMNCDCHLYSFYHYLNNVVGVKLDSFLNTNQIRCESPNWLKGQNIVSLTDDIFSCSLNSTQDCPVSCFCGTRGMDGRVFVNCSDKGLDEVPGAIPFNTTVLYFDNNVLKSMDSLNDHVWQSLNDVHLDNNSLTTLSNWHFPETLRCLSVRNNNLRDIPQPLIHFIANQSDFQLWFGGNDNNCGCESMTLQHFFLKIPDNIRDINDVVCEIRSNGTATLQRLADVPDVVLCPVDFYGSPTPSTLVIVIVCSVSALLIITLLVYYRHRQLLLSFFYIHCNQVFHVCFEDKDVFEDKQFDAFVAYSSCDRGIVMELISQLEEKQPYFQLCIHERNWLPGQFIGDNIVHSVQSSKRTIIILSNNFIASPWFRLELQAAIFKVSKDRRNKMIVVLADKSTSLDTIDVEIRHVISRRTYLVWGERWFWEKLRYAMPRKSCEVIIDTRNKRYNETALMSRDELADKNIDFDITV